MAKKKVGRPTKYKATFCKKIIKYFSVERTKITIEKFYYKNGDEKEKEIEVANELPLIGDFCFSIGVNKSTLHRWLKVKDEKNKYKYPDFRNAYKQSKDLQKSMWIQNSLKNLYNPTFAIFAGKNMFGWRDKREIDHTSKGEPISLLGGDSNDTTNRTKKNTSDRETPQA